MRLTIFLLTALSASAEPGVVSVESGAVRGTLNGAAWTYRNIPYAAPPVGPLRWQPPQPAPSWNGERDASHWGPMCPQLQSSKVAGEEDCLQLNVWTPSPQPSAPAPVLFWIHGGAFVQGGASMEQGGARIYDARSLAERTAAVVVTINYRLGPLGYLALPELSGAHGSSGNLGTLDQVAALEWVRRNIAAFGGDPGRVMIFGESAGGVSVCSLVASPKAAGLFQAGAIQSGGCLAKPLETAETFGRKLAVAAGCESDTEACMRSRSPEELLKALPMDFNIATESLSYGGVVDGVVHPRTPLASIAAREHNPVPIIVGANADETGRVVPPIVGAAEYGALVRAQFGPVIAPLVLAQYPASDYDSPRDAFVALSTDARFVCTSRTVARVIEQSQPQPVFRYFFTFTPENANPLLKRTGTWHGMDVLYMFDALDTLAGYRKGPQDEAVANAFQQYWSALAATGTPVHDGLPAWPRWTGTDPYLRIDSPLSIGAGVRTEKCDFWDRLEALAQR